MMLTVDSAAIAPPPGPRNGGRTNGATDSTFQDYLDDVPTPDTDAPRNNRTSSADRPDDSSAAERQRKSRRSADDAWNVAAPPLAPPVVPDATDRPMRAVTRPAHEKTAQAAGSQAAGTQAAGTQAAGRVAATAAATSAATTQTGTQTEPTQTGPTQTGPTQTGPTQAGTTQTDMAASAAGQTGTTSVVDATTTPADGVTTAPADLVALGAGGSDPLGLAAMPAEGAGALPAGDPAGVASPLLPASPTETPLGSMPNADLQSDIATTATAGAPTIVSMDAAGATNVQPLETSASEPSSAPATPPSDSSAITVTSPTNTTDAAPIEPVPGSPDPTDAASRGRAAESNGLSAQQAIAPLAAKVASGIADRAGERESTTEPILGAANAPAAPELNGGQTLSSQITAIDRPATSGAAGASMSAPRPLAEAPPQVGPLNVDVDLGGEGLGPLRLRAKSVAGEVHLSLNATDPHVRATLVSHSQELRRDLQSSGLDVASFDVGGSPDQEAGAPTDHGEHAPPGQERSPGSASSHASTTGVSHASSRSRLAADSIRPPAGQPRAAGLDLRL